MRAIIKLYFIGAFIGGFKPTTILSLARIVRIHIDTFLSDTPSWDACNFANQVMVDEISAEIATPLMK
jgi:hypothetical protein